MGTPEEALAAAQAEEAALPDHADEVRDRKTILAGSGQNIAGLAVYVIASFGMSILIARAFTASSGAFGQITLMTQLAFVMGAATRFGMDMASVRRVAIEVGKGEPGSARAIVRIAVGIAVVVSVIVAAIVLGLSVRIGRSLNVPSASVTAAGIGLVFVAVAQVYLGGSRGLKIMRHTLYAYWIGQSIGWIVIMLILWSAFDRTVAVTVWAYTISWVLATGIALVSWRRVSKPFAQLPAEPGEARALIRYGAPRAPAALLSQALFYADLAVLSYYKSPFVSEYAAALRVAQALVLFLTAISYMFSPFVADLFERGLIERLNDLFKRITRWTLSGTIPLLLLLMIAPSAVLAVFGGSYSAGTVWLRILLIGQIVNVSVGAAGFILIMVGRTGWDLLVYALSFVLDLAIAISLVPSLGPRGAAIAQATALIVSNALRLWLVWRFVRIQPYDRYYARLLTPSAIGATVMVAVHAVTVGPHWAIDLLATGLIGGTAYYVALLFFGLRPEEKASVMGLMAKVRA